MTDPIQVVDVMTGPRGAGLFGVTAAAPVPAASATVTSASGAAPQGQDLQTVLQDLGKKFQDAGVDVTFSIDHQLDRVIVKVIDNKDGTVLRQIPSEDMLHLARTMSAPHGGALLHEAV